MSFKPSLLSETAFRWEGIEVQVYKNEGDAPFKDVTRQLLFSAPDLACQLRYFEVANGGYTTLERHQHSHSVMILRGQGSCLVGKRIFAVKPHDLVAVPPMTWHQFRADQDEPLGFLCLVSAERDRPQLPTEDQLQQLRQELEVARFIRV